MAHWQYHNPVAVHFGAGVLDIPAERCCAAAGVLVTFPEARRLRPGAAAARACSATRLAGVIDETQPNPDVAGLDALYDAFWREQRDERGDRRGRRRQRARHRQGADGRHRERRASTSWWRCSPRGKPFTPPASRR